jgi:integrase
VAKTAAPRRDNRSGTWWFVVDLAPTADGKRRQVKRRGFPTKKAAQLALDELRHDSRHGTYVPPARQTLGDYLVDDWLPAIRTTIDRDTLSSYERNVRLHVVPALGGKRLQAIDGPTLNKLYADLLTDGRKDGRPGGLSARSVRYLHTILHRAFRDAVRWRRLPFNPADAADPPSASAAKAPEMKVWTKDELRRFLELMEGDRYQPAFLFLATTGCRRGEAVGLRWSDVNLDAGLVSIRQTLTDSGFKHRTKTGKARVIELDARTVAALRSWKAAQAQERLLLGAGYQDHNLVFCLADGRPYVPKHFAREFLRRLGRKPFRDELPRIRMHDLRHTWATLALIAGIDVKIVSERLGHSSPMVTWSIYQHVVQGMQTDAAERVASLIFGPTVTNL